MRSKRRKRLTIVSITVTIGVIVTTNPEVRHLAEFLFGLLVKY
jgi:hypothetical protein